MVRLRWCAVALCAALSIGCKGSGQAAAADVGPSVVFRIGDQGRAVQVKAGERFDVVLSTRGAADGRSESWAAARVEGEAVEFAGKEVKSPGEEREGPALHTYHFVAKRAGGAKVSIGNYGRKAYDLSVEVQ